MKTLLVITIIVLVLDLIFSYFVFLKRIGNVTQDEMNLLLEQVNKAREEIVVEREWKKYGIKFSEKIKLTPNKD